MNKRIKKKQLKSLQNKVKELIKKKDLDVTVTLINTSDLAFAQILEVKKMFDEVDVKFQASKRKTSR